MSRTLKQVIEEVQIQATNRALNELGLLPVELATVTGDGTGGFLCEEIPGLGSLTHVLTAATLEDADTEALTHWETLGYKKVSNWFDQNMANENYCYVMQF